MTNPVRLLAQAGSVCSSWPWPIKLPTCRQHVATTAKCWHILPKCPCRGNTILIPTHFLCRDLLIIFPFFLEYQRYIQQIPLLVLICGLRLGEPKDTSINWVPKQYFLLFLTYVEMYHTSMILSHNIILPLFQHLLCVFRWPWCHHGTLFFSCICGTKTFFCFRARKFLSAAPNDGQRLWPIPSPAALWCPNRVRRYHPHTMGNDACARLCVILSGARAVSHPPTTVECSKGSTMPWADDKRLFLALMAIGEKGQSTLWLNPRRLPSLGSKESTWILVSSPVMGFPLEYIYLV